MKFVVYGRPGCGWCKKAIELIIEQGDELTYFNVRAKGMMETFMIDFPDAKTVPQVICVSRNEKIGGFEDLEAWYARG